MEALLASKNLGDWVAMEEVIKDAEASGLFLQVQHYNVIIEFLVNTSQKGFSHELITKCKISQNEGAFTANMQNEKQRRNQSS